MLYQITKGRPAEVQSLFATKDSQAGEFSSIYYIPENNPERGPTLVWTNITAYFFFEDGYSEKFEDGYIAKFEDQ